MEEQKRNPAAGLSESEQVQVRRQKLADLQAAGNDPFTLTKFPQDAYSADLKEEFKELPNETDSGKLVALAGRMMSKRVMGKASFAHLRDDKGDIQLYVRRDELGDEAYAAFKKLDVGDIIGVKGEVFRTKTGELSVRATELTLLAKSLRPLPEKFHGLTDTEMRYRQRYVDLIANPEVKDTFIKRSRILKEIRAYLDEKGFLEVDTPILTPFEIGASARPFYTHHNTLNMDMVLRIETELYLKRLIVGGMDRVYEVGRIFRNEGMDPKHNPEFTTVELYQAYTDFHGMMDIAEGILSGAAKEILGTYEIQWQGETIDLTSDNSGGFYLGASYGGGRTLNGYVAECRVWTRALSQSEIANNMNYADPTSDGLLAYWRMNAWEPNDSGSGNIVRDLTGHGYDAVGGSSNPTMMDTKWN